MRPLAVHATLLLCTTLAAGCTVTVAGALDERDANLVTDALNDEGVSASKQADPSAEGRYQVVVARAEAAQAIAALREHDLPPRHAPGVAESVGKGALVPSPLAEHAQYVSGLAGDLERSLATVDGVLGARVHLSIPLSNGLQQPASERATASVLLRYRGAKPPLSPEEVQRLVAGAVANLAPDQVTVVPVALPARPAAPSAAMVHMGPISVAKASAPWLRGTLVLGLALLAGLLATVVVLWLRMRRLLHHRLAIEDRS